MKLGKRSPSNRPAVAFGQFLTTLPEHPLVDAAPSYRYPMDDNDRIGDCVVAGWDHSRQIITGLLTGAQQNLTEAEIIALYKTQNPDFDPNGDPNVNGPGSSADGGMDIQVFLEHLVATKAIIAFCKIDHTNEEELKAAIYLGLSVMTGVQLQEAQMQQFPNTWDYDPNSPTIGGHCIPLAGYQNAPDGETAVSWGSLVPCTKAFVQHTMEEAWFILLPEHIAHPGFRNHFDLAGFSAAVSQITGGKVIVPVPPAPTPVPTPTSDPFTKNLHYRMSDPDVQRLQRRLASEPATDGQPCYRYYVSGSLYFGNYFGVNTRAAVIRYQDAHGITPDAGYLGPVTRAALNGS